LHYVKLCDLFPFPCDDFLTTVACAWLEFGAIACFWDLRLPTRKSSAMFVYVTLLKANYAVSGTRE